MKLILICLFWGFNTIAYGNDVFLKDNEQWVIRYKEKKICIPKEYKLVQVTDESFVFKNNSRIAQIEKIIFNRSTDSFFDLPKYFSDKAVRPRLAKEFHLNNYQARLYRFYVEDEHFLMESLMVNIDDSFVYQTSEEDFDTMKNIAEKILKTCSK